MGPSVGANLRTYSCLSSEFKWNFCRRFCERLVADTRTSVGGARARREDRVAQTGNQTQSGDNRIGGDTIPISVAQPLGGF